jgi:hypothetical protein
MQKIVNIIALTSGVISLAIVGSGVYVYVQRDQLIDSVKSQVLKSVTGSLPGLVDTKIPSVTGGVIPGGSSGKSAGLGIPR